MQTHPIPIHQLHENLIVVRIEEGHLLNFQGIHRHNFYELLYFSSIGENAVHSIDFEVSPVRTDCLYLLRPGQVYELQKTVEKGYLIAIQTDYFNHLVAGFDYFVNYLVPTVIPLCGMDIQISEEVIGCFEREYTSQRREELLVAHLHTLFTVMVLSDGQESRRADVDSRVLKLLRLIERYFMEEKGVDFYARQVSLSEKRLEVLTRRNLGTTVKGLIQQRILLEAKRLIRYDELSLKAIAYELGFSDASYFSRFFKTYAGVTAAEFRKEQKKFFSNRTF